MLPNPQETVNLVKFTEEILNGKLHFLCCVEIWSKSAMMHFPRVCKRMLHFDRVLRQQ